jgi:cysteine desulfurase
MKVYFDHAATTPLSPIVLEAMMPYFTTHFGNPSSIHSFGRETRAAIENSRKTIAQLLNTSPSQIFFTSSGTEADNTAILGAVKTYNIKHVISSKIEHHAVLHCLENLEKSGLIQLHFVELDEDGDIKYASLENLLQQFPNSLVSLMHGNNEIGNMNNLYQIADLCKYYQANFHSDTVQTFGSQKLNLSSLKVDFVVGSAHKFNGPKGVGILYLGEGIKISPLIYGGSQERNMRASTENVAGIVGLCKALEINYSSIEKNHTKLIELKTYFINKLKNTFHEVKFNGRSGDIHNSLSHILSVRFPLTDKSEMLLFNLDINGIAISGGSACNSGASVSSHVLNALYKDDESPAVRFSLSHSNKIEEIDFVINTLKRTL